MISSESFSVYDAEAVVLSGVVVKPTLGGNDEKGRKCFGLYVGSTGDVVATLEGGSTVTFKSMPVGYYKLRLQSITVSGTTATNLVFLYAGQ